MEADRALSIAAVGLGKRECGIVAADATADAGKGLTRRIVARAAAETVCVTKLDHGRIREGRTQRGLVVPRRFSRDRESFTSVALEDNVAGSLLILFFGTTAEEKH